MSDQILLTSDSVELIASADSKRPRKLLIIAYTGNAMNVNGFGDVVIDLNGMTLPASLPILSDHKNELSSIIASGTPSIRDGKLVIVAVLADSPAAKGVMALLASGVQLQESVGASPLERRQLRDKETAVVNGREITAGAGGLTLVSKSSLKEVSVCPLGADCSTSVSIAANRKANSMSAATKQPTDDQLRSFAAEFGSDFDSMNASQVARLKCTYDGREYHEPVDNTLEGEARRLESINAIQPRHEIAASNPNHENIVATLKQRGIEAGWDRNKTELEILRASRPQCHAPYAQRQGGAVTRATIEASLLISAGRESLAVKSYAPQVMESTRMLRGRSLVDLCAACLQLDHRDVGGMDRHELIRAGFSTTSLPVALSNAMGKTLLDSYRESAATWRSFAKIMPAANFKPQTTIRPSASGTLDQLPAGGEIHHSQLLESTFDWSIDTFAKMLTVDRQSVINDDTSFISETPALFGKMASRAVSDLVWSTILANAGSFFSSGHGNLLGSGSGLSLTSLAQGIALMRKQRDSENNDIDIKPSVLAVSPELETLARSIINSALTSSVSAAEIAPTGNALQNIAKLEVESRLSNTAKFANASLTGWYLFASPMDASVIIGFLDGKDSPTVETFGFDHDVSKLALSFRVYFDYGAALGDYRAAVSATGAA